MAALSLPKPGEEYGPCVDSCKHEDCNGTRRIAESICSLCQKPIGFDSLYFQENKWQDFKHAVCVWTKIENENENENENES